MFNAISHFLTKLHTPIRTICWKFWNMNFCEDKVYFYSTFSEHIHSKFWNGYFMFLLKCKQYVEIFIIICSRIWTVSFGKFVSFPFVQVFEKFDKLSVWVWDLNLFIQKIMCLMERLTSVSLSYCIYSFLFIYVHYFVIITCL